MELIQIFYYGIILCSCLLLLVIFFSVMNSKTPSQETEQLQHIQASSYISKSSQGFINHDISLFGKENSQPKLIFNYTNLPKSKELKIIRKQTMSESEQQINILHQVKTTNGIANGNRYTIVNEIINKSSKNHFGDFYFK